ncbi:helix-turn-helix domain-containing protein [Chitinophagaceae bacterium LB-8]|uniref:Helix-turn-helix domain-containing protein n=1 Tax=Paraflavisolibacter caeni TaxID=2982496 RepID=A0A9X2XQ07_9BACT|nr:helix-turn-helix domain-containing protein [Paraflavisolibacter caeni]MCU7552314.1 helix-turn-helix domain-containing protein [Paraflavisolibacter caeni]
MKVQLQTIFRFFRLQKNQYNKQSTIHLSHETVSLVIARMNSIMELEQPYLHVGYSIKNLADELKIPSYQLSAILNRELSKNFNNYINQFRVTYFKELVKNGMANNLNLKGLSEQCGFNNRNSFTAAFKKFTGEKPSEYLRRYLCNHQTSKIDFIN